MQWFRGVTVSTQDFESCDPGSNPGGTFYGDVAQLVERSLSMREVRGSTPRISMFIIILILILILKLSCYFTINKTKLNLKLTIS